MLDLILVKSFVQKVHVEWMKKDECQQFTVDGCQLFRQMAGSIGGSANYELRGVSRSWLFLMSLTKRRILLNAGNLLDGIMICCEGPVAQLHTPEWNNTSVTSGLITKENVQI